MMRAAGNNIVKIITTVSMVVVTTGLTGCSAMLLGDGGSSRAGTPAATTPPSDAAVVSAVRSRLAADPSLQTARIDVRSYGGRVTLAGVVTSYAERERAGRLAASVGGVTAVDNRLIVDADGI